MKLEDVSVFDLECELERRKRLVPTPLGEPDWSKLYEYTKAGVRCVAATGETLSDFPHYCFEAALEAVFGPDIWTWWNANDKG